MFTGIIEEKAKISKISTARLQKISIQSGFEVKKGDSIAIQGICFTVTEILKNGFSVEAMKQTKDITTLSGWHAGSYVNLERSLEFGDRLGGHLLLGHIDELGKLIRVKGNEHFFQIRSENTKHLIPKGSIGIDGVSLTIHSISKNIFSVSLIPYTLKNTTLGNLRLGSFVNIEYDYIAKIIMAKTNRH